MCSAVDIMGTYIGIPDHPLNLGIQNREQKENETFNHEHTMNTPGSGKETTESKKFDDFKRHIFSSCVMCLIWTCEVDLSDQSKIQVFKYEIENVQVGPSLFY